MKKGQKYYTFYSRDANLPDWCETKLDIDALSFSDICSEWVYGESPAFDDLAKKRCKIFIDKDQCLKEAHERLYELL